MVHLQYVRLRNDANQNQAAVRAIPRSMQKALNGKSKALRLYKKICSELKVSQRQT